MFQASSFTGKLKDGSEVKICIQYIKMKNYYENMQFYNILLHSILKKLGFIKFGKKYFDPSSKNDLQRLVINYF